ncbi:MAG: PEP-CTERM sorting domain-containing protein [Phycisphaeraceae bacterium]|nr:PEP-CTERM sorting domain-containing protein [Phycisphaeraceae bacterium]
MSRINLIVALVLTVMLTSAASASVYLTYQINNIGVTAAGYDRWMISAVSTVPGELVGGFDITFTALSMRQVNPAGNASIFQDANGFFSFVGEVVENDSQFLFLSSEITAPAGVAHESSTQLRAAFVFPAGSPRPGQNVTFAQVVVPTGIIPGFTGQVSIANAGGLIPDFDPVPVILPPIPPEPTTLALLGLGGVMCLRRCRA